MLAPEVGGFRAISTASTVALSVLYTFIYVGSLYVSSASRPRPGLSRDAPSVIRARVRAVNSACIICLLLTLAVLTAWAGMGLRPALHALGLWPIHVTEIARALLLTAVLFAGPLFERGVAEGKWKSWLRGGEAREVLRTWVGWRNFVIGPVTEEAVFRAALVPLHRLSGSGGAPIVWLTPLYFGVAHVHHCYEFRRTHPRAPLLPAVLRAAFQFAFTSAFGSYAAFVFLRTASLPAVVLAHAFCNWCGLPRVWGAVEPGVPIGPPLGGGGGGDGGGDAIDDGGGGVGATSSFKVIPAGSRRPQQQQQQRQKVLLLKLSPTTRVWLYTTAYYVFLVAGAVGFCKLLWPLTECSSPLMTF